MKKKTRSTLVTTLFLSLMGLGMAACVGQAGAEETGATASESALTSADPVTCTSDCSGTGGAAITETCSTSCSATSTSVTCNGVTTQCAVPKPPPVTCKQPPKPVAHCGVIGSWHWCGCPDPSDPDPRGWVCGVCQ